MIQVLKTHEWYKLKALDIRVEKKFLFATIWTKYENQRQRKCSYNKLKIFVSCNESNLLFNLYVLTEMKFQ